jgi:hypothetical protein
LSQLAASRSNQRMPYPLHPRLGRLLLLLPLQGCAASTPHPDEVINLLPCGQPVDLSCDERQSSYSILPSTRPPVVDADGRPRSVEASRLPKDSEHWRPEDAALAERVASGMFGDSIVTRQYAEIDLAQYLLATGDDRGAGVDLIALIVKQGRHWSFFTAYRWLLDASRECPSKVALETFAVLPTELFWDHGRGRGQAKAFRARGLFELGYYHAASVALQDPSIVEMFPAFAAECQATISALPVGVLEASKRKAVPDWEGASYWKPHGETAEEPQ